MLKRSLIAVLFCANAAFAASPTIRAISPTGAQRGTELEITFAGERLADGKELLWYSPGFVVKEFAADPGNFIKAKIAIAADCSLGLHGVRVRSATGISNLLTFSVGALPEVAEVEPNSEFDKPQKIALGSTVSGVIENEDVDYFSFEAKQGQRINLEIEGLRLGYSFFDLTLPCSTWGGLSWLAATMLRSRGRMGPVGSLPPPMERTWPWSARVRSAAMATASTVCTLARFRGPRRWFRRAAGRAKR
jgi:hypothetical protein